MKKSICFWAAMIGVMTLCADPAAHIPAGADAALFVRSTKIKAYPALWRIAKSGDLASFEKPLQEMGVSTDSYVVAFFGTEARVVLADAPERDAVFNALAEKYKGNPSFSVEAHTIAGRPAVTKIFYLPPRTPYHSLFEAVWLGDGCVAFGDDDDPLPHDKLLPVTTDEAFLKLSAPGLLAAAYISDLRKIGFNIMGLGQDLYNIRLYGKENNGGLLLVGYAVAHDPQKLPRTAVMVKGLARLLCVGLFGADKELCRKVTSKISVKTNGNMLILAFNWDAETTDDIQKYYDKYEDAFNGALDANIQ